MVTFADRLIKELSTARDKLQITRHDAIIYCYAGI